MSPTGLSHRHTSSHLGPEGCSHSHCTKEESETQRDEMLAHSKEWWDGDKHQLQSRAQGPSCLTPLHSNIWKWGPAREGCVHRMGRQVWAERKRQVQKRKKCHLKMGNGSCQGQPAHTRTHKTRLCRPGAVRLPHLTPEESAELLTSPGRGGAEGRHRGWLLPAVCGSGLLTACSVCLGPS